jgi:hypothetical protein
VSITRLGLPCRIKLSQQHCLKTQRQHLRIVFKACSKIKRKQVNRVPFSIQTVQRDKQLNLSCRRRRHLKSVLIEFVKSNSLSYPRERPPETSECAGRLQTFQDQEVLIIKPQAQRLDGKVETSQNLETSWEQISILLDACWETSRMFSPIKQT